MRLPSREEIHRNRTILDSHLRHVSGCRVLYGVLILVIGLKTQGDVPLSSLRYRGIFKTYHMGQFSTSTHGKKERKGIVSFVYLSFSCFLETPKTETDFCLSFSVFGVS